MEILFDYNENNDEFQMIIETLESKVTVSASFDDWITDGEQRFSVYTATISENDEIINTSDFTTFPQSLIEDFATETANLDEIKSTFFQLAREWYDYTLAKRNYFDKKTSLLELKYNSTLAYE